MKKILVWHQGALGDLLLSLPAVHAIRKQEENYLHLVCRPDLADVILRNRIADETSSNEQGIFAGLFSSTPPQEELRLFLRKFSAAFVFMKKLDHDFFATAVADIPACRFISTGPPQVSGISMRSWQLDQLKAAGIPVTCRMPVLDVPTHPSTEQPGGKIIILHPGSGGERKCWPLENYLSLMRILERRGRHFLRVLLGPAESGEVRNRTLRFIGENGLRADVIMDKPLSEIASQIKMSSVYVGNDSGITHLAAMLGTPTMALFGPTDNAVWGPSGEHVRIVRSGCPCSPCDDGVMRTCEDRACLGKISVQDVLNELDEML